MPWSGPCGGCDAELVDSHHGCSKCFCAMHAYCGKPALDENGEEEEGYGAMRVCDSCDTGSASPSSATKTASATDAHQMKIAVDSDDDEGLRAPAKKDKGKGKSKSKGKAPAVKRKPSSSAAGIQQFLSAPRNIDRSGAPPASDVSRGLSLHRLVTPVPAANHLRQLIPAVLKEEMQLMKEELEGQQLSVIFDSTPTESEVVAVVIRYVPLGSYHLHVSSSFSGLLLNVIYFLVSRLKYKCLLMYSLSSLFLRVCLSTYSPCIHRGLSSTHHTLL